MTDSQESTIRCPLCNGTGFIFIEDENGYESAKVCSCQYERIRTSLLRESGFPMEGFKKMTLDTFKTDTEEQKKMKDMAIRFLNDKGHWLGFFGASGAGKTHICIAVCQELCKRNLWSFKYAPYRSIIRQLRSFIFDDEKYGELMHDLVETEILYIDDLLKFSQDQKGDVIQDELRILYDIINERYLRGKITVFSSEYSMRDILSIDEALGSRIIDYIGEYGFKCSGKNYRLGGSR